MKKKIYDLQQLIEISKSLNSTLDYNNIVQSILYICMGQLKMLRVGLFTRKDIDKQSLILHRSIVGFDVDHQSEYIVPENHSLLKYLQKHPGCHTYQDLLEKVPDLAKLQSISSLEPQLIVPLWFKESINGLLLLGDPIENRPLSAEENDYVVDIATLAGIAVNNAFLYEITTTDIMTKLKMRHFFIDALKTNMQKARKGRQSLSLFMLDIDHFKNFNDSYGHVCGDSVIRQIGQTILHNIRQTDLAARYGGEEFVIMLPDTNIEDASIIAERIRAAVESQGFVYQDRRIELTISIGVAEYNAQIDQATVNFIDRADAAMYVSKRDGRNRVSLASKSDPLNKSDPLKKKA